MGLDAIGYGLSWSVMKFSTNFLGCLFSHGAWTFILGAIGAIIIIYFYEVTS